MRGKLRKRRQWPCWVAVELTNRCKARALPAYLLWRPARMCLQGPFQQPTARHHPKGNRKPHGAYTVVRLATPSIV